MSAVGRDALAGEALGSFVVFDSFSSCGCCCAATMGDRHVVCPKCRRASLRWVSDGMQECMTESCRKVVVSGSGLKVKLDGGFEMCFNGRFQRCGVCGREWLRTHDGRYVRAVDAEGVMDDLRAFEA